MFLGVAGTIVGLLLFFGVDIVQFLFSLNARWGTKTDEVRGPWSGQAWRLQQRRKLKILLSMS